MGWLRWMSLVAALIANAACDCEEYAGVIVEVVDAETLDPVADAEVVVAYTIYSPRKTVDHVLEPGEYWLWARAPGYRRERRKVTVDMRCASLEDDDSGRDRLVIEMEPR